MVWPLSLLRSALSRRGEGHAAAVAAARARWLVNDLLARLGVSLSEADLWVNGVRCDDVAPVN